MQRCLRRLYSAIPDAAATARTASTPLAVRRRRLRKQPAVGTNESDATPDGLTPTEFARYQRALAKGELMGEDGLSPTEAEWLEKLNGRRSRMRGVRQLLNEDGEKEVRVVGQKIYLPNIIFRLVRNHTPAGQPYNPYEATFRISQSVTKTDVRSYLQAVYGVKTTYIRTDNYLSPYTRDPADFSFSVKKVYKTYKRAVVGLVEPFYYPQAKEDMNAADREKREKWLEENFGMKLLEDARTLELLRRTRGSGSKFRWRTGVTAQRGNILRIISQRRAARELAIADTKERMRESRQTAEAVTAS
ncbi:mitochondrial ribosomal protein L23 [Sparassis latifolia]|uniref:Large ribosomal subunit protein uL23m n=1 Tax=Sparassis crispa TaxID=139825 RepID=A0A401GVD6_9APHY|nr:mitochondrial ribosomal protein [Sparassis crispa]GBE86149.1 mitochondrial ribosomal protein [Sparassis crispa]